MGSNKYEMVSDYLKRLIDIAKFSDESKDK